MKIKNRLHTTESKSKRHESHPHLKIHWLRPINSKTNDEMSEDWKHTHTHTPKIHLARAHNHIRTQIQTTHLYLIQIIVTQAEHSTR